jgi:hypothetical protein
MRFISSAEKAHIVCVRIFPADPRLTANAVLWEYKQKSRPPLRKTAKATGLHHPLSFYTIAESASLQPQIAGAINVGGTLLTVICRQDLNSKVKKGCQGKLVSSCVFGLDQRYQRKRFCDKLPPSLYISLAGC